jgi:hypothetical protein
MMMADCGNSAMGTGRRSARELGRPESLSRAARGGSLDGGGGEEKRMEWMERGEETRGVKSRTLPYQ